MYIVKNILRKYIHAVKGSCTTGKGKIIPVAGREGP
jgi:hypothetical protein